ncbi:MAG: 2-C-methyl-D-erythritol 4-phosphate cytidylyltransferase [Candidatus Omnitrophica bacterium]|nr:2-C-methyl-D-erythritol 4-phosphate cytidylyltransferase [Candidatus Omnitrophota bacterium]
MQATLILLAAGMGKRMSKNYPKALIKIGGKPVFVHTLINIGKAKCIGNIIIVVPAGYEKKFSNILTEYGIRNVNSVVKGGLDRVDSVCNGILAIDKADYVFIHDAARPFISVKLLRSICKEVIKSKAVIPAVPVRSTVKICRNNTVLKTLDRDSLYEVQTPQAFKFSDFKSAIVSFKRKKSGKKIWDDSCLMELIGRDVTVVDGDIRNIKITYSSDLDIAESLFKTWK